MVSGDIQTAIHLCKAGHKSSARRILERILDQDPYNVSAWLWMADAVEGIGNKKICLENALELDHDNKSALKGLE